MFNRRGFTLIEMLIAVIVIGIGLGGVMTAFSSSARNSADPLISKQIVAIAEEVMEEILLKPYAISGAAPGNGATSCGTVAANRSAFDDVRDYNSYQTTGICDIDGLAIAGLANYNLQVTAADIGAWQGINNTLRVTVTVTRGNATFTLTNWRTNPI